MPTRPRSTNRSTVSRRGTPTLRDAAHPPCQSPRSRALQAASASAQGASEPNLPVDGTQDLGDAPMGPRDTSSDVWIRRQSSMSIQKGTETTAAPNVIRVTAAGTDRLTVPAPSRVTIRSRKAWVLRRETSPTMRSTRQGMQ